MAGDDALVGSAARLCAEDGAHLLGAVLAVALRLRLAARLALRRALVHPRDVHGVEADAVPGQEAQEAVEEAAEEAVEEAAAAEEGAI